MAEGGIEHSVSDTESVPRQSSLYSAHLRLGDKQLETEISSLSGAEHVLKHSCLYGHHTQVIMKAFPDAANRLLTESAPIQITMYGLHSLGLTMFSDTAICIGITPK
ncbi:hypothetical protein DPMN_040694 [Dreissena polymorpha]|uniref:Uncharacterized protein n=1 Tax=Dreissena polymorpha TaxID=45954 RepID=A0A9D4CXP8_DREPO|nr:hypothetical protein DPMN_040694 [Dreissena polymorpha]